MTDPAVLAAIERTPRDLFTPDLFKERSWEDSALPIACGQTISQPFIVGLMTQALTLEPRARVLEIGTGSGYQTAVLSRLARLVYTIERYRTLKREAEARFETLGLTNVITKFRRRRTGLARAGAFRPHSGHGGGAVRAEDPAAPAEACRRAGRADRQGTGPDD